MKKIFHNLRNLFVIFVLMSSIFNLKTNENKINFDSFAQTKTLNANLINDGINAEVFSYESVLKSYYYLAIGDSKEPSMTFSEFFNDFYSDESDRDLYRSTLLLASQNDNYDVVASFLGDRQISMVSTTSTNNGGGKNEKDACYILKNSSDIYFTPSSYFAQKPLYGGVYDYSSIKTGDIIYETENGFIDCGHTAIIETTSSKSEYGNFIRTIEAVADGGVQRGFLDDYRMVRFCCSILRVVGRNDDNAQKAIDFSSKQVGKSYSLNTVRLNTSVDSKEWYCSELTYAAWKSAGIDIGVKKTAEGKDAYLTLGCLPSDIQETYNTCFLNMPRNWHLSLSISRKNGNTWILYVHNNISQSLTIEYNSKMCFSNHAKDWIQLSDIKKTFLSPYGTTTILITENYAASSVAVSYVSNDYRYITYADNLSETSNTMSKYYSIVPTKN